VPEEEVLISRGSSTSTLSKSGPRGDRKIRKVMEEYKEDELRSGGGIAVADRKQAVAIALNEARKRDAKIPRKTGRS
jgi:hypothetical protein